MIPNAHIVKTVLIAILISIGIVVSAKPRIFKPQEKAANSSIEVMPSVFDSLVQ